MVITKILLLKNLKIVLKTEYDKNNLAEITIIITFIVKPFITKNILVHSIRAEQVLAGETGTSKIKKFLVCF